MRRDYQVPMILKTLKVLEALAKSAEDLSLTGIAQQCKIAKASAFRILETLHLAGYLEKDPANGRYRLSIKILELGSSVDKNNELRSLSAPFLLALQQQFNESTNLAVMDCGSVLYLATVESSSSLRISRGGEIRRPIHCTALGKILAAFTAWETIQAILRLKGLSRKTSHTITELSKFRRQLQDVRRKGLAYDDEELEIGSWCVAAPVFDYTGSVVCALSLSVPLTRVRGREGELSAAIKTTAAQFSAKLGYKSPKARQI